jgi:hypothetical protein
MFSIDRLVLELICDLSYITFAYIYYMTARSY